MSKSKPSTKESKFTKIMKTPLRVLIKARDFYIQSMTECSGKFDYGSVMGCPTVQVNTLPKSFSVGSTKSSHNSEDYRELVKAASTRSLGSKIELDFRQKTASPARKSPVAGPNTNNLARSQSVGFGRIDEDKPCEFDDQDVKVNSDVYPRSRSHAVRKRTTF